jgi:hypothetical protein
MSLPFEIKLKPGVDLEEELEKLHPLLKALLFHLKEDGDVAQEGIDELNKGLHDLKSDPSEFAKAFDELTECSSSWSTLAVVHGKPYYQKAGKKLLAFLRTPEMMQAYGDAKAKEAEAGRNFQQFADKEGPKAPKVGEEAPEGSVKLDKFNYPRKL